MTHDFDREYWEQHWHSGPDGGHRSMSDNPPSPYLDRELGGLPPGTALDAGCGAGAEAIWLALAGWQVTGADISAHALARAAERAVASGVGDRLRWIEADLSRWRPEAPLDLVTTHYAHAAMPQLEFYARIAAWVAPGGTLLIVGHRHGDGHETPAEASVTAAAITARLDDATWDVVTADEPDRTLGEAGGQQVRLRDVVVRATRRHR